MIKRNLTTLAMAAVLLFAILSPTYAADNNGVPQQIENLRKQIVQLEQKLISINQKMDEMNTTISNQQKEIDQLRVEIGVDDVVYPVTVTVRNSSGNLVADMNVYIFSDKKTYIIKTDSSGVARISLPRGYYYGTIEARGITFDFRLNDTFSKSANVVIPGGFD